MELLFSVVIPVYNCKMFLAETVRQVRNAGLWDYEILLIDDGSADGTEQVCDALVAEYTEVRCIHQHNAGVSSARNRGIEEAKGDYILFFDADDGVDTGALRNAAQIIQDTAPDMLIFGMSFDYYFCNRLYRRDELVSSMEGLLNRSRLLGSFYELYQSNMLSPVWNKFISRKLLANNRIRFTENLIEMEDFVFSVNCLTYCDSVYMLPEAIYRYRQAESERNTYHRLRRIESLTGYMKAFESCIGMLSQCPGVPQSERQQLEAVVDSIYATFFFSRIRYAKPAEIKEVAIDMQNSVYVKAIQSSSPVIFQMLENEKYGRVWLRNLISRVRHWIAVRAKYLLSFRRKI